MRSFVVNTHSTAATLSLRVFALPRHRTRVESGTMLSFKSGSFHFTCLGHALVAAGTCRSFRSLLGVRQGVHTAALVCRHAGEGP